MSQTVTALRVGGEVVHPGNHPPTVLPERMTRTEIMSSFIGAMNLGRLPAPIGFDFNELQSDLIVLTFANSAEMGEWLPFFKDAKVSETVRPNIKLVSARATWNGWVVQMHGNDRVPSRPWITRPSVVAA
jgi:hypothetical protein